MHLASLVFTAVVALAASHSTCAQTPDKDKAAAAASTKSSVASKEIPAKPLHDGLNPRVVNNAAKAKAASPPRSTPAEMQKDDCHSKGNASDA